jgi:N-methylhydantoinase A
MAAARYRLGVDVGGTFTDFVLLEETTGALYREKCLTTPHDPVAGIMEGIARLHAAGIAGPGEIRAVAHATTLVTNTLIERKGARTGLLATEGFRDLLELGSDMRYDMYDLAIEFPAPLVDRPNRLGIRERVSAVGESLEKPRAAEVRRQAAALRKAGVASIAVCFLHSYRNPEHEREVGEILRASFPDMEVSLSSTVAPEIREYERTVTVVANAYVKPALRSYLGRLAGSLRTEGVSAPILVMLSNGGMTTPNNAAESPIRMVESGPAAGVLSACHAGARIGEPDLLGFDMGGTTAKACFVDGGKPAFTGMFEAARVKRQFRGSGMPLKVPSVEMIEIGAGGGSIARVDGTGLLKVGPDSAGAAPGPVCYGRGGAQPTITDADLVLGYLDPKFFLGGDMPLDLPAAHAAIATLGKACGLDPTRTAAGIVEVVNQNMATAVRIHAAERGKDYRRYALFAFGGAGPVHAYEIARILGLKKVICPLGAGTNSAFGLLTAPVAIDLSRSYNAPLAGIDWSRLNDIYRDMETEAKRMLRDAGIAGPTLIRTADMRFVGQGFELPVPVPGGKLGKASVPAMREAFHAAYQKVYDGIPGDLPMETITWRLRASGPTPKIDWTDRSARSAQGARPARPVYFPEVRKYLQAQVHDRYALAPGDTIAGPAVVEERESTAIIGPRGTARIDADLNLVIELADRAPAAG